MFYFCVVRPVSCRKKVEENINLTELFFRLCSINSYFDQLHVQEQDPEIDLSFYCGT